MPDLIDELGHLHADGLPDVPDTVVAADLARGRRALRIRRVRRGATTVLSAGLVTVVAVLGFGVGTDSGAGRRPGTAGGSASAPATPGPAVQLVAWNGAQLPGFTVTYVPEGFVLQGVSDSVLDIARPDDTTPLDSFVGKLVVMLSDQPLTPPDDASPVTFGDRRGWYASSDGAMVLTYDDAGRHVVVQAWNDLHLSRAQLVQFAAGVTVTADAVPGHG